MLKKSSPAEQGSSSWCMKAILSLQRQVQACSGQSNFCITQLNAAFPANAFSIQFTRLCWVSVELEEAASLFLTVRVTKRPPGARSADQLLA